MKTNFNEIKNLIFPRLVSEEYDLDKDVVTGKFGDCVVIYAVTLSVNSDGELSFLVKRDNLEEWGITQKELDEIAVSNMTLHEQPQICRMDEVISAMFSEENPPYSPVEDFYEGDTHQLYTLSNESLNRGAGVILCDWVLDRLGDAFGSDIIILPSSIHEVIVISAEFNQDFAELASMVREINNTEVRPEERLSYSVYSYSTVEKKLYRYKDGETVFVKDISCANPNELWLDDVEEII